MPGSARLLRTRPGEFVAVLDVADRLRLEMHGSLIPIQACACCAQVYRRMRTQLIDKYREDTSRSLSFTDCRRALDGDASVILRIWTFLNDWRLINFQAADQEPQAESQLTTVASEGVHPTPSAGEKARHVSELAIRLAMDAIQI